MLTVNLTTTLHRLSLCRIALISLLLQSTLPDRINLWVSKEQYLRDQGIGDTISLAHLIESVPESSRSLISVRWVSNTGPYRKLIPILREAGPDDVIVTADDDIFYGQDWLSGLLQAYDEAEGMAVAARVRTKRINFLRKRMSYVHWNLINQKLVVKDNFIVTFGGGAVLTRAMFRERDIADDSFLVLAPSADDLWYSKLLRLNNHSVVVVPSVMSELNFILHTDGLNNYNFPHFTSLLHKIKFIVWNRAVGFFGVSVCGNDVAHSQINSYFDRIRND